MRKMNKILIAVSVAASVIFLAAGLYAAASPETIPMNSPGYKEHTKGIVTFSHKKHVAEYGDKCADCHHDKDGKPLATLKEGDATQKCIECHKLPGEMPKDVKDKVKALPKDQQMKEQLKYQAEAAHENCRGCHKAWNKEKGKKGKEGAPTGCNDCHPKK